MFPFREPPGCGRALWSYIKYPMYFQLSLKTSKFGFKSFWLEFRTLDCWCLGPGTKPFTLQPAGRRIWVCLTKPFKHHQISNPSPGLSKVMKIRPKATENRQILTKKTKESRYVWKVSFWTTFYTETLFWKPQCSPLPFQNQHKKKPGNEPQQKNTTLRFGTQKRSQNKSSKTSGNPSTLCRTFVKPFHGVYPIPLPPFPAGPLLARLPKP